MEEYLWKVIVLILFILLICWLFGSRKRDTQQQPDVLRADPTPVVAPITSIGMIRSKLQDFILINLPFDQSAVQTYSECSFSAEGTSGERERCPKQGGLFLVEYDSTGVARFTSFVSQMDDYNTLVASGVPTMIIDLPSSAEYMGEIKLTA